MHTKYNSGRSRLRALRALSSARPSSSHRALRALSTLHHPPSHWTADAAYLARPIGSSDQRGWGGDCLWIQDLGFWNF